MAERKGRNRSFVLISSTSEEEEEEDDEQSQDESESQSEDEEEQSQQESDSESEEDDHDEDDDYSVNDDDDDEDEDIVQEISDSTSCDDDDDADGDENESDEEDYQSYPIEAKSICEKIVRLLQGRRDLQEKLSLTECKAYLREHGLRLSGTKAECIERIKEHWRIKDGNGEAIYPRSSFNINCTGDVCKGDVVLFSQKVYEKFDKVTRTGNPLGKRTIAGRIVKESYGAAKQQHTFTVEVLWSKGLKKLPPLFPLLVKGRNLYKLKTYRQRWKNEAERSKVLDEKHKRGAAARLTRAMKKSKNTSHTNAGAKRQNDFNHNPSRKKQRTEPDKGKRVHRFKKAPGTKQQNQSRRKPSQMRQRTKPDTGKSIDKRKKAPVRNSKSNNHHHETREAIRNPNFKQHQSFTNPNGVRYQTFPSHCYAPHDIHHHRAPLSFPSSDLTSNSSMMIAPQFRPYANSSTVPLYEPREFNHGTYPHNAYVDSGHEYDPRKLDRFSRSVNVNRPLHPFPVRREMPEQRRYGFL